MEQFTNMIAFKLYAHRRSWLITVSKCMIDPSSMLCKNKYKGTRFLLHINVTIHVPYMDLFAKDTLCTPEYHCMHTYVIR